MLPRAQRRRARVPVVAAVLFACRCLLGCAAGNEPPPSADGGAGARPHIELGSGYLAFEAQPPDARVPLIMGLQGGYHVWVSFVTGGFSTDVVHMALSTRWAELEASRVEMAGSVALRPVPDVAGNQAPGAIGWPASIFKPTCANGQRLLLEISLTDEAGLAASDDCEWVVDVPEEYRSSDCGP